MYKTVPRLHSTRLIAIACGALVACTALSGAGWAQGAPSLPLNPPTSTAPLPSGTAGPVDLQAARGSHHADVTYTGGVLAITAANSSLNAILREVARLTGMKITGGVQEDRVFGTYGPGPASQVIASLLDGTSSNVLIVENATAAPAELILTPRRGEPTPPNPNASADDAQPEPQPQPQRFVSGPGQYGPPSRYNGRRPAGPPGTTSLPPSNGGQTGTPVDGGANLGSTPGAFTGAGQTPPDATAQPNQQDVSTPQDNNQAAPNSAPSTPQQIYEQLQRLRQQQGQQPTPDPR